MSERADSAPPAATPAPGPRRRRRFPVSFQTVVVLLLAAVGGYFGLREVQSRYTHVNEVDARVSTNLVVISSRVAGWVTRLEVEEGQPVEPEQVLSTIDARESALRLSQLQAQVRGIKAERERLDAERELIDFQTRSRLETRMSRLRAAEASVASLEPQLELARSDLARAASLYEKRVIAKQQLEQARAAARQIEGEHRMSTAEREESRAEVEEARVERMRLAVLDRELDKLVHREAELDGSVEQQRLDVEDRTIRSPIAGIVDRTFVEIGEYVRPGQRIAIVHDPANVWIEANIKETQIRRLKVGQSVAVTVDAYPEDVFRGRVQSIGSATTGSFALLPNPNPSGNFTKITQRLPVRVEVEQREGKLRPGMMVEIEIDVR